MTTAPPGTPITATLPVVDDNGNHTSDIERTAYATPIPGILIEPMDEDDDYPGYETWRIFHQRSGATIVWAEDPEQAQHIAAAIGHLADWTGSAADLQATLGIKGRGIWKIAEPLGAIQSPAPRISATELLNR